VRRIGRRTARALLVVGLLGSQIWLVAAPAHAALSDTCAFDKGNAIVSGYGGSVGFAYRFVREAGTKKILFESSSGLMYCQEGATKATVVNTDYIQFAGTDSDEGFVIDLSNGPFEPGLNPELEGAPEIEFDIDLFGGTNPVSVIGGPADDSILWKGPGYLRLNPDGDNDVSITSLTARLVYAGGGDDRISIDYVHSWLQPVSFWGGPGNDELTGGDAIDALHGGGGDDDIDGQASNDTLTGDRGDDRLHRGLGDDVLKGGPGDDSITGGDGLDQLYGGTDADILHSDDGSADQVSCGGGKDDASQHDALDTIQPDCEIT
jgi:Ca2+-binding RTX toxin-like protein